MIIYPQLVSTLVDHYDELVDYIRRRFGDKSFAREVIHDVCIHVLDKPTITDTTCPLALLKRISHNKAVDQCRTEDVRRRLMDSVNELSEIPSLQPDQLTLINAQQEIQRLADTISAMPMRCQQVFIMHKIHEIPQNQVAKQLNISLKMVEKHLRIGMTACRQAMDR